MSMESESKEIEEKLKEAHETPELKVVDQKNDQLAHIESNEEIAIKKNEPQKNKETEIKTDLIKYPRLWPGVLFAFISISLFAAITLYFSYSSYAYFAIVTYHAVTFTALAWWSHSIVRYHQIVKQLLPKAPLESVDSVKRTKMLHLCLAVIGSVAFESSMLSSQVPFWLAVLARFSIVYFIFKETLWSFKFGAFIYGGKNIGSLGSWLAGGLIAALNGLAGLFGIMFWPWYAFILVFVNNLIVPISIRKHLKNTDIIDFDSVKSSKRTVIRYRKYAAIEKWLKHRFTGSKSSKGKLILAVILAPVLLFLGFKGSFELIFWLTNTIKDSTASGGAAGASSDNIEVIKWFLLSVFTGIATGGYLYTSASTHIELSADGISMLKKENHGLMKQKTIAWSKIDKISIEEASAGSNSILLFHRNDGGKPVKFNLASIPSIEEKQDLLNAIEKFAPAIPRTSEVILSLQLPPEHSYTELWLQALAAPPKREKLQPLQADATVKDGRYRIEGKLGVGGQGFAYLAKDTATMKTVVLKEFILPVFVDMDVRKAALKQFESEAKILSQLDHPQIVKLEDFMVEDHRAYLVLEHIDGKSLREIVKENGPLPEDQVKELSKQMCTVLEHLHSKEPPVVHRDFTPDNLILNKDGTLKLIDFNVAQQTDSTTIAKVVGKQAYLPPEQFQGKPTSQSDIYAMGCTMHYLLTGQDPIPISQSKPCDVNNGISSTMNSVVSKATSIKLDNRYKTSLDVLNDLEKGSIDFIEEDKREKKISPAQTSEVASDKNQEADQTSQVSEKTEEKATNIELSKPIKEESIATNYSGDLNENTDIKQAPATKLSSQLDTLVRFGDWTAISIIVLTVISLVVSGYQFLIPSVVYLTVVLFLFFKKIKSENTKEEKSPLEISNKR